MRLESKYAVPVAGGSGLGCSPPGPSHWGFGFGRERAVLHLLLCRFAHQEPAFAFLAVARFLFAAEFVGNARSRDRGIKRLCELLYLYDAKPRPILQNEFDCLTDCARCSAVARSTRLLVFC